MEQVKSGQCIDQISTELTNLLISKGYGADAMLKYQRALSNIKSFMFKEGMYHYTEEVGEAYLAKRISSRKISKWSEKFHSMVVRRLNDVNVGIGYRLVVRNAIKPAPVPYDELLQEYLKYCSRQGNKERTIEKYCSFCKDFLCFLSEAGCTEPEDMNTSYICRAIIRFCNKDAFAAVRAFLAYLYTAGTLEYDFSGIIPKYSRSTKIPTTYTTEEIKRIESVVDRNTKTGKRDYAALLLATRLGMRSGDIVRLTFKSVDFAGNIISLSQEKTCQPLILPLLPDIQKAIEVYIKDARPNIESEYIFLSVKAPFNRMSTDTFARITNGYFLAAGINKSGKKHGPHSFRSSLASSMVNDNVPYEIVRRVLGHNNPNAIKHYAKIDIENLRNYAIDVPTPTGEFKSLLEGAGR